MANDNGTTLRRAIEACTLGRAAELPELFTPDVSAWSPVLLVSGLPGLTDAMSELDSALTDVEVHIDALDAFGNKAVAEYRITARFTGPYEIEDVVAEPNGHLIVLGAAIVAEFEGGKIKAYRNYFDEMALLEQMFTAA